MSQMQWWAQCGQWEQEYEIWLDSINQEREEYKAWEMSSNRGDNNGPVQGKPSRSLPVSCELAPVTVTRNRVTLENEMRASDMIESKYLKQADLKGEEVIVTVERLGQGNVAMDDKPEEIKWMVKFKEFSKPMVLNSTNIRTLERLLGDETDDWVGKEVVLYVDENVSFGGELVGGLRLKSAKPATAPKRFNNPAAAAALNEKDIPF